MGLYSLLMHSLFVTAAPFAEGEVGLGIGYRIDASDTVFLNPFAGEIYERNVHIHYENRVLFSGFVKATGPYDLYVRAYGDYGVTINGKGGLRDVDVLNEEALKFTMSVNNDNAYDFSGGVGYELSFCSGKYTLAPLVGFAYHRQNNQFTSPNMIIGNLYVEKIDYFKATYTPRFYGLMVGFDCTFKPTCSLTAFGEFEYHRAYYRANYNEEIVFTTIGSQISAFSQITQQSNQCNGFRGRIGAEYSSCSMFSVGLALSYLFESAYGGWSAVHDPEIIVKDSSGTELFALASERNDLKKVWWQSFDIDLTVTYRF